MNSSANDRLMGKQLEEPSNTTKKTSFSPIQTIALRGIKCSKYSSQTRSILFTHSRGQTPALMDQSINTTYPALTGTLKEIRVCCVTYATCHKQLLCLRLLGTESSYQCCFSSPHAFAATASKAVSESIAENDEIRKSFINYH